MSFFIIMGCSSTRIDSPAIKAGLGETVITPGENVRMRGFARSQVSTGVHDELHARSLVVENTSGSAVVLMTVALCGMSEDYAGTIRAGITEKTGIPGENIVISCTHTHAGPNVGSSHDTYNKRDVDRSVASLTYRKFLVDQCIASAVQAWENRVPARIGIGSTTVMELGRNRRRLLYGGLHPDPEVAVIKVEDAGGTLMGVAFNYGCYVNGFGGLVIGDRTIFGPNTMIHTANHEMDPSKSMQEQGWLKEPVSLGKDCWIGMGVMILPGVTIGDGVVIGAGSVVSKDLPSYTVAVGNPCKVIKERK